MTRLVLVGALVLAGLIRAAHAVDITSCPASVPARETGVLQNDIQCQGLQAQGVLLGERATLLMNGHTITSTGGFSIGGAVSCLGNCKIAGPGEISGAASSAIGAFDGVELEYYYGHLRHRVDIRDISIHHVRTGIQDAAGYGRITATNLTVTDCTSSGITAGTLRATNVQSNSNRRGVVGLTVRAVNLTTNDNTVEGILTSKQVSASGLTATGNGSFGVSTARLRLLGSMVTGNGGDTMGYAGSTNPHTDIDIAATRRPRLVSTVCGRSVMLFPPFGDWDVCLND